MQSKEYNGWTNYETWAVGMFLDGNYTGEGTYREVLDIVRETCDQTDDEQCGGYVYNVAEVLKDWFDEMLPEVDGIAADLLRSAVGEINWQELAQHKVAEIDEEERNS